MNPITPQLNNLLLAQRADIFTQLKDNWFPLAIGVVISITIIKLAITFFKNIASIKPSNEYKDYMENRSLTQATPENLIGQSGTNPEIKIWK